MVTARLTADFRQWTIELFAERCREAFPDVSVLPNATVLKHGLVSITKRRHQNDDEQHADKAGRDDQAPS
jgi:hypothetical protein